MRKMKIVIAVIMTMALSLLIAGCSQKTLSVDNYNKTIQQLCNNNDFKNKVLSYLQKDPLGFFIAGLHSSNISMFENSSPKCDLSDTSNICFKKFVKVEAIINIAKEQKILIDTTPFYVWKEAVLNGENIQPYLDDLLDKNFSPAP